MVVFKKLHSANKKLVSSKLFILMFIFLIMVLIIGSIYVFLPEKNSLDIIGKKISSFFPQNMKIPFLKNTKVDILDEKDIEQEIALNKIFSYAPESPHKAIQELEKLNNLPTLLENRKNYFLSNLYLDIGEVAAAFISIDQVSRDYLPRHTLFKKALMAKDLGLEAVVVEDLRFLNNKFPLEAKFEYELAKSYLRQNIHEEAQEHFLAIQETSPDSDYAIGAQYYLSSLSSDPNQKQELLISYLKKSPDGSLANLAANQLLDSVAAEDIKVKTISNNIAISFYKVGQYKKALEYFNPDLDRPEFFLKAYAESLYQTDNKTKAIEVILKYLPRFNIKDNAIEVIDYMLEISSKSQAIANLKLLENKVLENVKDKILWELGKKTNSYSYFTQIYTNFPDSFYAAESMSKVFWQAYLNKEYAKAIELSKKHWALYPYANSHPFVAFWAAKIKLSEGKKLEGDEILNKLMEEHPHDYYSYRAKQLMKGEKKWFKMPSANSFVAFPSWVWPKVFSDQEIVDNFGADVLELTKINQFKYLLEYIPKDQLVKKFKMFLQAKSGDYMSAIRTAYFSIPHQDKANHSDLNFQYAFPLAYADLVFDKAGKNQKVDPMLVHSLIRQESFYQKDIVSKVGAIGLMQLMPSTAKGLARQMNMRPPRRYDLMQPKTNIALGVLYMEQVFAEFENNMINAIASYNAGPGAVKSWVNRFSFEDPDLYIESIPYEETRNYVKKVLNNYWIYRDLYS